MKAASTNPYVIETYLLAPSYGDSSSRGSGRTAPVRSAPVAESCKMHYSPVVINRDLAGGDENLIAVILLCPLYYRRHQSMTSPDKHHGSYPTTKNVKNTRFTRFSEAGVADRGASPPLEFGTTEG